MKMSDVKLSEIKVTLSNAREFSSELKRRAEAYDELKPAHDRIQRERDELVEALDCIEDLLGVGHYIEAHKKALEALARINGEG